MLARYPICTRCKPRGIYRPTDEIDHVVPLDRGGADEEHNLTGLCAECHEAKTAEEAHWHVSNHPDWLERSRVPLTIVCGPPCSGKSTLARMRAGPHDLIIELDEIMTTLDPAYRHWQGDRNRERLDDAIRIRNRMLGSLAHGCSAPHAWFVVSAPSAQEREWWLAHLGGELVLLHPGVAECKRRAITRGTPAAIQGIDEWQRRSREPWSPHGSRVPISEDGWPVTP